MGGLVTLGYALKRRMTATTEVVTTFNEPLEPDVQTLKQPTGRYRTFPTVSQTAGETGIGGTRLPYFTSAHKQHHSGTYSQRKMEAFTGHLEATGSRTGTWTPKREAFGPEPNPGIQVTAYGAQTGITGYEEMQSRLAGELETGIQNNVAPVGQERVGPGLGLAAGETSTDGLHPTFRVLPDNVNAYRLTQLPGMATGGAPYVQQPQTEPGQATLDPKDLTAPNARMDVSGRSALTGQSLYPAVLPRDVRTGSQAPSFGVPHANWGPALPPDATRTRDRHREALHDGFGATDVTAPTARQVHQDPKTKHPTAQNQRSFGLFGVSGGYIRGFHDPTATSKDTRENQHFGVPAGLPAQTTPQDFAVESDRTHEAYVPMGAYASGGRVDQTHSVIPREVRVNQYAGPTSDPVLQNVSADKQFRGTGGNDFSTQTRMTGANRGHTSDAILGATQTTRNDLPDRPAALPGQTPYAGLYPAMGPFTSTYNKLPLLNNRLGM